MSMFLILFVVRGRTKELLACISVMVDSQGNTETRGGAHFS